VKFSTINPATEEVIQEYETMTADEVLSIVGNCHEAFLKWREVPITERAPYLIEIAKVLRKNDKEYASLMTLEMGKAKKEALAEVEKCAWAADVYAENGIRWLESEKAQADGLEHIVSYEPIGVVLSVMPWNFPFWQALRFAIPTILAGNVSVLKHSNTVPQCAFAIEDVFKKAGLPENVFRTVLADHATIAKLIESDLIAGVSLTGSTFAGAKIAEQAGRNLKKVVLELGGSDPFIVLDDVDIEVAAKNAVLGRLINTGQSCVASKRFIVLESVAQEFSKRTAELMNDLVVDDPSKETTDIGPLVNEQGLNQVSEQVEDAIAKGATVLAGGKRLDRKGYFYPPTLLSNVTDDMKVVTEEVFGPAAPVIVVKDDEEAIKVANSTEFGLGGSVWTKDIERGKAVARRIESGLVFVNSITKSDPRMPFGGVKKSGLGRELSKYGLKEFVNIKALNVYEHN